MEFREKLRRASAKLNKAQASRDVGLKPTIISTYIVKGSIPRADIAMKMARALRVPFEWLVDDAQDWPPPRVEESAIALAPDHELLYEVARRFRLAALRMKDHLDRAEKIDWRAIATQLLSVPVDAKIPAEIQRAIALHHTLDADAFALMTYDPSALVDYFAEPLPGDNLPDRGRELKTDALSKRLVQLKERADLKAVEDAMALRLDAAIFPENKARDEAERLDTIQRSQPKPKRKRA